MSSTDVLLTARRCSATNSHASRPLCPLYTGSFKAVGLAAVAVGWLRKGGGSGGDGHAAASTAAAAAAAVGARYDQGVPPGTVASWRWARARDVVLEAQRLVHATAKLRLSRGLPLGQRPYAIAGQGFANHVA